MKSVLFKATLNRMSELFGVIEQINEHYLDIGSHIK